MDDLSPSLVLDSCDSGLTKILYVITEWIHNSNWLLPFHFVLNVLVVCGLAECVVSGRMFKRKMCVARCAERVRFSHRTPIRIFKIHVCTHWFDKRARVRVRGQSISYSIRYHTGDVFGGYQNVWYMPSFDGNVLVHVVASERGECNES